MGILNTKDLEYLEEFIDLNGREPEESTDINERKLFLETTEFRSIENDTFIDFDGETLEDL